MNGVAPGGRQEANRKAQARKERVAMTIAFIIIGLSVAVSYDWGGSGPGFRSDAGLTILLGILVAAIIFIASKAGTGPFRPRFCPNCGRQIPFDALLCPYCGHRLP